MMAGHFAAALAAKPLAPRLSLGWLVAAAFALDLAWPLLLMTGVESVTIAPGDTAFTPLRFDHYPWSHGLLPVAVWSAALFVFARPHLGARAAGVLAALVFSHWVLDFVTHRPDLPLWFDGPLVGLGLWRSVPGTLAVEGALLVGAAVWYWRRSRPVSRGRRIAFVALVITIAAIWIAGPFAPPPPGVGAIAAAGAGLWLFPLWAWWADRR